MTQMILHHYPNSPFAEKIRLIFGFKKIHWSSVIIPNMMPKPDLIALTGGYRRTPVLQIGADIYCDTSLIADVIEQHTVAPTLYPQGIAAAARTLAQWADSTLFWTAIPFTMQPVGLAHMFAGVPPDAIKAFSEDRNVFRANTPRMRAGEARAAFVVYLERLEEMLQGREFFLGLSPSIADFSIYHCLWFTFRGGPVADILASYPVLDAWRERMKNFGHGSFDKMDSTASLALAHSSTPAASPGIGRDTHGFALGDKVVIAATDTGVDPIEGTLFAASRDRIAIARVDARAGQVVVHFPRLGFEMRRS